MARAFLLVLDSVGVGGAPDADRYGDAGANTIGHVAAARAAAGRTFSIPNLLGLGLGHACELASGSFPASLARSERLTGQWGCATERARGKDTPSGHWEIAGLPLTYEWHRFPDTVPCFPADFSEALVDRCGLPGLLGNRHASGIEIIETLGAEHLATGKPIAYTSVDSVIQIAAHETAFGLGRLYDVCAVARRLADPLNVGRVIARPFVGGDRSTFARTANRRDYAVPPPGPTLLDRADAAGRAVVTVGKIADIFAHRATGRVLKAPDNDGLLDRTLEAAAELADGGFLFANFVDFDTVYGHRRDADGYAAALEAFDRRLPEFAQSLEPGDLAVITADHGCDPGFRGTDHTRERVPVLAFGPGMPSRSVGIRDSFADIGQTVAAHLGLKPLPHGTAWEI